MNILEKRFKLKELHHFEAALREFHTLDLKTLGILKQVIAESRRVPKTQISFSSLKGFRNTISPKHKAAFLSSVEQVLSFKQVFEREKNSLHRYLRQNNKESSTLVDFLLKSLDDVFEALEDIHEWMPLLAGMRISRDKDYPEALQHVLESLTRIKHFCTDLEEESRRLEGDVKREQFINYEKKTYGADYAKWIKQHPVFSERIAATEEQIERSPVYMRKLHKLFSHGIAPPPGYTKRHARLTSNFRIYYLWNPRTRHLHYHSIIDHHTQERLSRNVTRK